MVLERGIDTVGDWRSATHEIDRAPPEVLTLIIDNYDSFTYNLFQCLAEVNGLPPDVVHNDDPAFTLDDLRHYDNVVISPGPGHPERAEDFGICADVIRSAQLPLLGVCLGHQGLCHLSGGEVRRASEVRHGRLSPVLHEQEDLFAGLPSPLQVVRYHSLAVTRLPEALEATAWTPDGVLMGVRHRTRPAWGVQFHPESICTEHGTRLLHNYAELTRRWQRQTERQRVPRPRPSRSTAPARPDPPRRFRVLARQVDASLQAERVFDELFSGSEYAFWLDSSLPKENTGRFSFMGDGSGPLARAVRADVGRCRVEVESADGVEEVPGPFLEWLEADLRSMQVEIPDLPFDFALGWVGYLGYELKAECGGDAVHHAEEPDASLLFADRAIAFDHRDGGLYLLALAREGDDGPARAWLERTAGQLHALASVASVAGTPEPPPRPLPLQGRLTLRHDPQRYLEMIDLCQQAILAGETYEVCLTNMVTAPASIDPWAAYRFLRHSSPAPFAALLRFGTMSVLSTSPERFVRVGADRVVESKPIKGTRPRGRDPEGDERLRRDLASNEKDRAENLMIVDLVRNDLGRCAEVGSVHVSTIFGVETYATVHQLVSTIRARLRPDFSAVGCVRALFPGGSMTGAPKIRTMQIIDRLEAGPRGVYSGALGYFSLSGAADLSIVIRTLVLTDERASFGVGGAIVALSSPVGEFEETAVKATAMLRLFAAAFPALEVEGTG